VPSTVQAMLFSVACLLCETTLKDSYLQLKQKL
jgi:hypothetical protein